VVQKKLRDFVADGDKYQLCMLATGVYKSANYYIHPEVYAPNSYKHHLNMPCHRI